MRNDEASLSRDRLAEVEGLLEVFTQFAPVGDPLSPDTQQGPLVSKVQQERVRSYITAALEEGAKLVNVDVGSSVYSRLR